MSSVSTPGSLSPLKHGIGIQQSNLWITQLSIRLVAVQYRKELVDLRWTTQSTNPAVLPRTDAFRQAKLRENELSFRDDRDHILSSLLRILQALPIHLIGEFKLNAGVARAHKGGGRGKQPELTRSLQRPPGPPENSVHCVDVAERL